MLCLQDYSVEELKSIAMLGLVSYNVTAKDLILKSLLREAGWDTFIFPFCIILDLL